MRASDRPVFPAPTVDASHVEPVRLRGTDPRVEVVVWLDLQDPFLARTWLGAGGDMHALADRIDLTVRHRWASFHAPQARVLASAFEWIRECAGDAAAIAFMTWWFEHGSETLEARVDDGTGLETAIAQLAAEHVGGESADALVAIQTERYARIFERDHEAFATDVERVANAVEVGSPRASLWIGARAFAVTDTAGVLRALREAATP